ncbi:ABC transporter substrate-binding protein [Cellulomonas soli]|uniref:ABC transporter substrate-binding protein n=1 Tax=Cellulomonas soli TaxID=931535 RepID=UPI003F86F3C1
MTSAQTGRFGRYGAFRRGAAWVSGGLLVLTGLAACTQEDPGPTEPDAVVVTTSAPFLSLNGALPDGSSQGSRLVRGAVQERLTRLDVAGELVTNTALGTVEKIADAPLTVRYTIAEDAVWSDGVPITADDLLLEWAARSGRFDEVGTEPTDAAEQDAAGETPAADPSATASDVPAADVVRFGATSAALVHAETFPVVDGRTFTLVYDTPVADWRTALDIGLPAHVVGRLALADAAGQGTPSPSASTPAASPAASSAPSSSESPLATDTATDWAAAVRAALQTGDRTSLIAVADVWRTGFDAEQLAADPTRAVSNGAYVIGAVVGGEQVELLRNDRYPGEPAPYERIVVRTDLDQLSQVDGLEGGDVDAMATVAQADLLDALADVEGADVVTGAGRVLQLVTQVAGGGVFDAATYGGDAAQAQAVRRAFLATVPREQIAQDLAALHTGAEVSDCVLPALGAQAPAGTATAVPGGSATATPATAGPAEVRLLVVAGAAQQDSMVQHIVAEAATAGFDVQVVEADDPAAIAWREPAAWDVALVPAGQSDVPVSAVVDTWRTGGAVNLAGLSDATLDQVLDGAAAQPDPEAAAQGLQAASARLLELGVVLPLVQGPGLTASAPDAAIEPIVPLDAGAADLTDWWDWARAQ